MLLILCMFFTACVVARPSEADVLWVPNDFATIQGAIDAATDGDIVVVSSGTYQSVAIIDKAVTLVAMSGPTLTSIVGDGTGPCVVARNPSETARTVISGFSIVGGSGENGGGVYAAGSVVVADCVIEYCGAINGGGVFLADGGSLVNSTVRYNVAINGGGVCVAPGSHAFVQHSTLKGNTARLGGGIAVLPSASHVAVTAVDGGIVDGNTAAQGGGVAILSAFLHTAGAVIGGNTASAGGGVFAGERAEIAMLDGAVIDNAAADGAAAIVVDHAFLVVRGAEVSGNIAGDGSAAMISRAAYIAIDGVTFAGNSPRDLGGNVFDMGSSVVESACPAAMIAEPYDTFDIADIIVFVNAFVNMDPGADIALPREVWDVNDLLLFVSASGC